MSFLPDRSIKPAPLLRGACLIPLVLSALLAPPAQAQANDMFPTKAAALKRAKELKCTGAFAMGTEWMPCKDFATYEKAARQDS
jgi:hypothetical protein